MTTVFNDKTKWVLHPMPGFHNVFFAAGKNARNPNGELPKWLVVLHPRLAALLPKVIKKRPSWVFRSTIHSFSPDHRDEIKVTRLEIFDGGEHLGYLEWDTMRGGRYVLDSPALKAKRRRDYATYTQTEQRALSLLMNAYHRKSPKQIASEASGVVRDKYYTAFRAKNEVFETMSKTLSKFAMDYVLANFNAFLEYNPAHAQFADFPRLRNDRNIAVRELGSMNPGSASAGIPTYPAIVAIKQETNWLLFDTRHPSEIRLYTDANMPPEIRGRITMLSLMDVGQLEPGVGARVTDTVFALVNMQLPA